MCNILAAVLAKTPKGALRSKFAASSQILMRVAEQHLPEVSSPLYVYVPAYTPPLAMAQFFVSVKRALLGNALLRPSPCKY